MNSTTMEDEKSKLVQRMIEQGSPSISVVAEYVGMEGIQYLCQQLNHNKTVKNLRLVFTRIGPQATEMLANMLKANDSIEDFILFGNQIGAEGAKALGEMLQVNRTLQRLELGGNSIGDQGAEAIAEGLVANTRIRYLYLGGNNIGDKGAEAIAKMLIERKQCFSELVLSNNHITSKGATEIANSLRQKDSVRRLHLDRNMIEDPGAIAFGLAIKTVRNLLHVELWGNTFTTCGLKAIIDGLESNFFVETLEVSKCKGGDGLVDRIDYFLDLNSKGHRSILRDHNNLPTALWSHIFAKVGSDSKRSADLLQYLLTGMPDLLKQDPIH